MTDELHHEVCFMGVPALLVIEDRRHIDDLVHELRIVQVGQGQGRHVAPELAAALGELLTGFAGPRDEAFKEAVAAVERGDEKVDLHVVLHRAAADDVARLLRLLGEADSLAEAGLLLTLPASEPIRHFRRWVGTELARQMGGADPTPYEPPGEPGTARKGTGQDIAP